MVEGAKASRRSIITYNVWGVVEVGCCGGGVCVWVCGMGGGGWGGGGHSPQLLYDFQFVRQNLPLGPQL